MASEWYYRTSQGTFGPFTPAELRAKALAGDVRPGMPVSKGTDGPWVSAGNVKGLFADSSPAPAAEASPSEAAPPVADSSSAPAAEASPSEPASPQPEPVKKSLAARSAMAGAMLGLVLATVLGGWIVGRAFRGSGGDAPSETAVASNPPKPELPSEPVAEGAPSDEPAAVVEPPAEPPDPSESPGPVTEPGEEGTSESEPAPGPIADEAAVPEVPTVVSEPEVDRAELPEAEISDETDAGVLPPSSDGFAPNMGPDPFAEDEEQNGPAEDPIAMDDAAPPETVDDEQPLAAETEARLQKLDRIFDEQVKLFREWKPASEELKSLEEDLTAKNAEWQRLAQQRQNNLMLARNIDREYRALQEQFGSGVQAPKLVQGKLLCEQNEAKFVQEMTTIQSDKAQLQPQIDRLKPKVSQLATQLDVLNRQGLLLCDLFGTSGPAGHDRSIDLSERWMSREPDLALPHLAGALAYAHAGLPDQAREELATTGELDRRLVPLCAAVGGYVSAKQGDFNQGRAQFAEAAKADPKLGIIYGLWGLACIEEEKLSQAESQFRKAIQLTKDKPELQEQLNQVLAAVQPGRSGNE